MKVYVKVTFQLGQKYIFCGRIKDQFHEPENRAGLLDPYQRAEINLSLRKATDGQVMFGGFELSVPNSLNKSRWGISVNPSDLMDTSNLNLSMNDDVLNIHGDIIVGISLKDECFSDLKNNLDLTYVSEVSLWNVIDYSTRNPCDFSLAGNWKSDKEIESNIDSGLKDIHWNGLVEVLPKKPKLK
jgi:hypothetical protein